MRRRVGAGLGLAGLVGGVAISLAGMALGQPARPAPSRLLASDTRFGPERHGDRVSWGVRAIGADRLHRLGVTGKGVTIAVIDSGLGADEAGLSRNLSNASIDIVPRRHGSSATDRHAVYIAETLVGAPEGQGAVGVAYGATVLSVRADSDGACREECAFTAHNLARAVDYAVAKHARIIDLSLAGKRRLGRAFEASLRHAVKAGAVVIIAAGNGGERQPQWPGRYAADRRFAGSVVAVGAVDKDGEITGFSDRAGPTHAHYITAPGQMVADCDDALCAIVSGTSFAAPHVAGALALIMEAFPKMNGRQALDLLLRSAQGTGSADGDTIYGRGRLDVYRAYQMALAEQG